MEIYKHMEQGYPPLTSEYLKTIFDLDREFGVLLWKRPSKYHSEKTGEIAGSPRANSSGKSYWRVKINGLPYLRSRLIYCIEHGKWPENQVDHINGDSLDDRPCNLRDATHYQNAWNHKGRAKKSTLPMGVRLIKSSGRYQARIAKYGRVYYLGAYDSVDEAHAVYLKKRKELFGEFA